MRTMEEIANSSDITEDLNTQYDNMIKFLQEAKEKQLPIDEGILGGLLGGAAGAVAGPSVMKTICKVLGIDEKGPLGSLMTSRLILTAVGAKLGWRV